MGEADDEQDEQDELDSSQEKENLTLDRIQLGYHNSSFKDVGADVNAEDQPMTDTTAFLS